MRTFLFKDVINEWYEEKQVKLSNSENKQPEVLVMLKKLDPFIQWLQESEDESDEDESDEDESEEEGDDE